MKNTGWVLFRGMEVSGIYTTYQNAIHAMMMRAKLPITEFLRDFGVDFFCDAEENSWSIEEFEIDKI